MIFSEQVPYQLRKRQHHTRKTNSSNLTSRLKCQQIWVKCDSLTVCLLQTLHSISQIPLATMTPGNWSSIHPISLTLNFHSNLHFSRQPRSHRVQPRRRLISMNQYSLNRKALSISLNVVSIRVTKSPILTSARPYEPLSTNFLAPLTSLRVRVEFSQAFIKNFLIQIKSSKTVGQVQLALSQIVWYIL